MCVNEFGITMKNEPTQSQEILRPQPLPLIKLLSLATVAWGVIYHGWLNMLGVGWLVWLILALLLLLEAGGADSRPADWSHGTAMLGRILGPAMLPFYGALCLLLALGPFYVRQTPVLTLPPKMNVMPNRSSEPSAFTPNSSSAPKPERSSNAPSVSSTSPRTFKRPNLAQPPATTNAKPQVAGTPTPAVTPPAAKPLSPAPAPAAPTTFNKPLPIQPSGSARPAPATPK
jgi:hypothetical protein